MIAGDVDSRTPDWKIQAVFDPDGDGHDFAYTIGLFDRGLPELHLWARPSLGDDPGADWMFSSLDCTRILNALAWRLVDGQLDINDTWDCPYDAGLVTARFRLDPPGDRQELEAYGVAHGALVLPVRWSLHRPPVSRPRPLNKRGLQRATSEYAAIRAGLPSAATVPDGWLLPSTFLPGGEFGPLTPMLAGRVAEFWSADAITLSNLLWAATTAHQGGVLTWPATVASAVARGLGRVDEVAMARFAARALVDKRMDQRDWPQMERELTAAIGYLPGEATPTQIHEGVRGNLTELLWCVLSTEVVADRLSGTQRLGGRGAWLTGFGPVGELPGPQWRAPRGVLDRLFAALRPLNVIELVEVAERHRDEELDDYCRLASAVQGWAVVAAAGCPWRGGLDRLPGVIWPRPIDELQEWATVMTSAACHRDRLAAGDVAVLTAPFLDLVPDLPSVISA